MSNLKCYSKEAKDQKEVLSGVAVLQSLCVQCLQIKWAHHSLALKKPFFQFSCCFLPFFFFQELSNLCSHIIISTRKQTKNKTHLDKRQLGIIFTNQECHKSEKLPQDVPVHLSSQ